jgi:hypothetical protein
MGLKPSHYQCNSPSPGLTVRKSREPPLLCTSVIDSKMGQIRLYAFVLGYVRTVQSTERVNSMYGGKVVTDDVDEGNRMSEAFSVQTCYIAVVGLGFFSTVESGTLCCFFCRLTTWWCTAVGPAVASFLQADLRNWQNSKSVSLSRNRSWQFRPAVAALAFAGSDTASGHISLKFLVIFLVLVGVSVKDCTAPIFRTAVSHNAVRSVTKPTYRGTVRWSYSI